MRTIGERLEAGFYTSLEMFAADFRRMFNNARIYNAPETLYYKVGSWRRMTCRRGWCYAWCPAHDSSAKRAVSGRLKHI